MKFLRQGFQHSEHEQDRQTHTLSHRRHRTHYHSSIIQMVIEISLLQELQRELHEMRRELHSVKEENEALRYQAALREEEYRSEENERRRAQAELRRARAQLQQLLIRPTGERQVCLLIYSD